MSPFQCEEMYINPCSAGIDFRRQNQTSKVNLRTVKEPSFNLQGEGWSIFGNKQFRADSE